MSDERYLEYNPKARLVWDIKKNGIAREILHGEYRCTCGYLRYKTLNPDDITVCGHCGSEVKASMCLYTYNSYTNLEDCFEVFDNWCKAYSNTDRDVTDFTIDVIDIDDNEKVIDVYYVIPDNGSYKYVSMTHMRENKRKENKKEEDN